MNAQSASVERGSTRRRVLAGVGVGAVVVVLAACSTPGAGSTSGGAATTPTSVSTTLGSEKIDLVLYDGAPLKTVDDALIAAFTKKYPNVTITGRYDPDDVQAQNAPRVLSSDNPPDIARIIALADVVKNGQLTNLDPWAKAYGWDKLPEGQLAQFRVSADGVRGSGAQYTVASGFTVTGFYYNKKLAEQVGMAEPPKTVTDLEGLLAKAKSAGLVPIMTGNQTGGTALPMQMMMNNTAGAKAINDWVFHVSGATIDTPDAAKGADYISSWAKSGYFNDDANGTDGTTASGRFVRGEGLFYPSGNWDAATLSKGMGDNVGFFLPPTQDGSSPTAMSDPLSNFGIPAKSSKKDAAAAFLNFLTTEEARAIVVENGFAPSGTGTTPTPAGVAGEVQKAFADLSTANGQVQFIQNATSGIAATWNAQVQLLVAGKTTSADMLTKVQAQYEDELKS